MVTVGKVKVVNVGEAEVVNICKVLDLESTLLSNQKSGKCRMKKRGTTHIQISDSSLNWVVRVHMQLLTH